MITNNADLIATIPQYVLAAMPYDKGHVIKITLS